MKETLWITGVAGFTGRHMVDFVRQLPDRPLVVGLDVAADANVPVDRYRRVDVADPAAVSAAAGDDRPHYVIHLAGVPPHAPANQLWSANVGGACGLLMGLAAANCLRTRVVGIGSAAEYGQATTRKLTERAPIRPVTAYGRTKAVQTLTMLAFGRRAGLSVSIARTFNLSGPGVPGRFVIGRLCEQFAAAGPQDTIELQTLSTQRDFVDVRDAVHAYWCIAIDGRPGRVYHVCTGRATRISTLVELLQEVTGKSVQVRAAAVPDPSADPDIVVGSLRRIRRELGWSPRIGLEQSLRDTVCACSPGCESPAGAPPQHVEAN